MDRRILAAAALAAAAAACTVPEDIRAPRTPHTAEPIPVISSLPEGPLVLYPPELSFPETFGLTVTGAVNVTAGCSAGMSAKVTRSDGDLYSLEVVATGDIGPSSCVTVTATGPGGESSAVIAAVPAELSVSVDSHHCGRAGACISVAVVSNVGLELLPDAFPWIHSSISDGGIRITVDRNTSFSERSGEVAFTDSRRLISRTISLSQEAAVDYASNERNALETLWKATGGEHWKPLSNSLGGRDYSTANWCTDAPLDTWYGVTLNPEGRVIYLHLADAGLEGSIPEDIGDLAFLQELWLGGNALSGRIPESLGRLTVLRDLDLSGMDLSGSLEDCSLKGIAPHLKNLSLCGNRFTGGFPEWIGDLPEAANFWLQENCLEGRVPDKVKAHPRWNAGAMDGTGRTVGQINMVQREGHVLE